MKNLFLPLAAIVLLVSAALAQPPYDLRPFRFYFTNIHPDPELRWSWAWDLQSCIDTGTHRLDQYDRESGRYTVLIARNLNLPIHNSPNVRNCRLVGRLGWEKLETQNDDSDDEYLNWSAGPWRIHDSDNDPPYSFEVLFGTIRESRLRTWWSLHGEQEPAPYPWYQPLNEEGEMYAAKWWMQDYVVESGVDLSANRLAGIEAHWSAHNRFADPVVGNLRPCLWWQNPTDVWWYRCTTDGLFFRYIYLEVLATGGMVPDDQ